MFNSLNPILIIMGIFLLFYSFSFFFLPVILLLLVVGGALGFAATSGFWLLTGPKQLWGLLSSRRTRANFALYHATAKVLQSLGWPALNGSASDSGFFIRGAEDENAVYEAAVVALSRLKNGEKSLAIYAECGTTKVTVNLAVTLIFVFLLFTAGQISTLSLVLAVLAAQVVGPMISPYVQNFVLGGSEVKALQILNATCQKRIVKALKGKISDSQIGVAVATSSTNTIEAEILEDE